MQAGRQVFVGESIIALSTALLMAGCGGGGGSEASPQALATSADRMHKLVVINPPPPIPCTPSPPVVANIDLGQPGWTGDDAPGEPVAVGTVVAASVSFSDDLADGHTVQWSWGDGTPSTEGSLSIANGTGIANADHAYLNAGVFTIAASVSDACGGAAATRQVVVFDPSAGFVTGGGWIVSPPGAYAAEPTLTGRANFGFVSKYHKGATTPSGETEFQFQTASLNFHSDSYDWLVVAGARAQFKGTGAINGNPGYKFMLTAIDGALLGEAKRYDRFRIKIWHPDMSASDVVDYDNQIDTTLQGGSSEGTAIGGGSIVIHK
jgi:hypothetical protein